MMPHPQLSLYQESSSKGNTVFILMNRSECGGKMVNCVLVTGSAAGAGTRSRWGKDGAAQSSLAGGSTLASHGLCCCPCGLGKVTFRREPRVSVCQRAQTSGGRNSDVSQAPCFGVTLVFVKPTGAVRGKVRGQGWVCLRSAGPSTVSAAPEGLLGYKDHSFPAQRWEEGAGDCVPAQRWRATRPALIVQGAAACRGGCGHRRPMEEARPVLFQG